MVESRGQTALFVEIETDREAAVRRIERENPRENRGPSRSNQPIYLPWIAQNVMGSFGRFPVLDRKAPSGSAGDPKVRAVGLIMSGTAIFAMETVMLDVWSCRLFWQWEGTVGIPPQTRGRS